MKITIFANTFYLISGGDVIFIQLAKQWLSSGNKVNIVTNEKGKDFCIDREFPESNITLQKASFVDIFPVFIIDFYKTIVSVIREIFSPKKDSDIIFASSFFLPDVLPAVISKIKNPKAKLIVGVYLFFPFPFGFKKYHGGFIKSFLLYISQIVSLFFIQIFSELVLTASQKDANEFPGRSLAIRGGVDMNAVKNVKTPKKKFDVVYFGRFHSQKGILDMLEIWSNIAKRFPKIRFLMVGGGPLEDNIKETAKKLNIIKNITFAGIIDGPKKYKLLKSAKLFTSASRFDTGNIALDEVLACGVPGVVYDLPRLNYPAGVIKVAIGKKRQMEKVIVDLLSNPYERSKLGKDGKEFIKHFDWNITSQKILKTIAVGLKKVVSIAVLHRYPPSQVVGTNASFLNFLTNLINAKHQVFYLTFKDKKTKNQKLIKDLKYVYLPFKFSRGNNFDKKVKTWLWILLSPLYVKYMQIRFGVNMVYCDDSVPLYSFLIKTICHKLKVVIRLGDLQTAYLLADSHPHLFKLSQVFESWTWKKFDGIVAISVAFRDYIIKVGVSPKKVKVVEESINLLHKAGVVNNNGGDVQILFHGSLARCKGVKTLIIAFSIVQKRFQNLKLVIAGGGDDSRDLKNLVRSKGIKNVFFTGWYSHNELDSIMNNTDIGVVMRNSNLGNNFVVTTCLLENWKYQIPSLVPRLKSFEKVVINNKNGIFFNPEDEQDLALKITDLIRQKSTWKSLGREGLKTAKISFNHQLIARKMVMALESFF